MNRIRTEEIVQVRNAYNVKANEANKMTEKREKKQSLESRIRHYNKNYS